MALTALKHQKQASIVLEKVLKGNFTSPVLLVGPSGVGKEFAVKQIVTEWFCETSQPNCQCTPCFQLSKGLHVDYIRLVSTKTTESIGIDLIRETLKEARSYPTDAPHRVFLIPAGSLTKDAANAFLKTLEEPPAKSRFFLIAECLTDVLPTIVSRCAVIKFNKLPTDFVEEQLTTIGVSPEDSKIYSVLSEGSAGKAIEYFQAGKIILRDHSLGLLRACAKRDISSILSLSDQVTQDTDVGLKVLVHVLHDAVMLNIDPSRILYPDKLEVLKELKGPNWPNVLKEVSVLINNPFSVQISFHLKSILLSNLNA